MEEVGYWVCSDICHSDRKLNDILANEETAILNSEVKTLPIGKEHYYL